MMPAVSVIILVHKVEEYIERCARGLFCQTLEDIEYIFVDDCTPDASMEILERVLEEFPHRRSQVRIMRNEVNRGQAYCRRMGVAAATGEYIIHCDSDDWPEPEIYARMYAKAREESLDMVICTMRRIYTDRVRTLQEITHTDDLVESLLYMDIRHYLCNKLVARRIYDNPIIWPEKNMCEDSALSVQLAYYSHSWGFVDEVLYNYNFIPESISSGINSMEKVEQIRANIDLVISFLESKGLGRKYARPIMHLKCWTKIAAFRLPRKYYLNLYPEGNLPLFTDSRFTAAERLGHLTKVLGVHGVSKLFTRKR